MKRFFDSVDAEWQSPIADEIARRWFGGDSRATCIRASANKAAWNCWERKTGARTGRVHHFQIWLNNNQSTAIR